MQINSTQRVRKKDEKWEQKELAHQLVCLLDKVVKAKQQKNHDTYEKENEKIKIGEVQW